MICYSQDRNMHGCGPLDIEPTHLLRLLVRLGLIREGGSLPERLCYLERTSDCDSPARFVDLQRWLVLEPEETLAGCLARWHKEWDGEIEERDGEAWFVSAGVGVRLAEWRLLAGKR